MIESSIELSEIDKRTMLMMSDLSGTGYSKKGEPYLTGYPLPKSSFYVLAKTWYANEMDRPGCVWTHSLLIPIDILKTLTSINIILKQFTRPSFDSDYDEYSNRLKLNSKSDNFLTFTNQETVMLKEITYFLYKSDEKSIVTIKNHDADFEKIALNIWLMQWPSLRNQFTFCTGSLSNRKINKKSLDLQFVDRKNVSEFKRNDLNSYIIDFEKESIIKEYPLWINLATNNSQIENNKTSDILNSSIFNHLGNKRSNFKFFTHIKSELIDHIITGDINNLLNVLSELNLAQEQIIALSKNLFGINSILIDPSIIENSLSEQELLFNIITNPKFDFLSSESLQIKERTELLIKKDNQDIYNLLMDNNEFVLSSHSYVFFNVISKAINIKDFITIIHNNLKVGAYIASQNPMLLCNKSLFDYQNINYDKLFEAVFLINNDKVNSIFVREFIELMLNSRIDYASDIIYEAFNKETIFSILDWINNNKNNKIDKSSNWIKILQLDLGLCIMWLGDYESINKNVVLILIDIFFNCLDKLSLKDAMMLSKAIIEVNGLLNKNENTSIAEFLFILSINYESKYSQELIDLSYSIIDKSIKENTIPWHSWSKIERLLPEAAWYERWDRAKRLRKYLLLKKYKLSNDSYS